MKFPPDWAQLKLQEANEREVARVKKLKPYERQLDRLERKRDKPKTVKSRTR